MIGQLRAIVRVTAMLPWTAILVPARLMAWPLRWISSPLEQKCRKVIVKLWAKGMLWLFGGRVTIRGPVPRPPFYSVSNHLSHIDSLLILAATGCTFVARHDMRNWPVVGLLARVANILFIDRTRPSDTVRVNDLITQAFDDGYGIHVFAESRISPGRDVQPFKSALLEPPARSGRPVHYAAITYRTAEGAPPASEAVVWASGVSYFDHAWRLLRLPRFQAQLTFGDAPLSAPDRKTLARLLHDEVQALFVPVE